MVGPGRRAHDHPRIGVGGGDQLQGKEQGAASARRLQADDPLVTGVFAKHDRPQRWANALSPAPAEVGFAVLPIVQALLRFPHRAHHGGPALPVTIHTHPHIDLVGAGIGVDHRDQRQQRVAHERRQIGEAAACWAGQHGSGD
jgi:hypothetical protein